MADDLTKEQRHKNMKNIHGKDTKIEVILRKALWNKGYRYRKNYKKLPGSPDIVLTKYKIAIFCDGEFFHGKDWDTLKKRLEKSNNSKYWINKISRNKERDDEINKKLDFEGWTVIRFWGEDIKKHTDECVKVVEETIFDMMINQSPVYNFINDRLVDESAVLRPLSWHLILYVFRYFSRKWQKISDCECPDLIQNETPVRFLYGTQKNVRSDRAESSWHSN